MFRRPEYKILDSLSSALSWGMILSAYVLYLLGGWSLGLKCHCLFKELKTKKRAPLCLFSFWRGTGWIHSYVFSPRMRILAVYHTWSLCPPTEKSKVHFSNRWSRWWTILNQSNATSHWWSNRCGHFCYEIIIFAHFLLSMKAAVRMRKCICWP